MGYLTSAGVFGAIDDYSKIPGKNYVSTMIRKSQYVVELFWSFMEPLCLAHTMVFMDG